MAYFSTTPWHPVDCRCSECQDPAADERPSVWIVTVPTHGACHIVHAVFATQALADTWIADNPTVCARACLEPWTVHTEPTETAASSQNRKD